MKSLGDRFHYLIVSQGIGLKDFRKFAEDRIGSVLEWKEFVDPVEVPRLLQSVSGLFVLQNDLPFPVFSNMVMEALYCNVTVITDMPDMVQSLKKQDLHVDAESRKILVVPSDEPGTAAETIINYFERSMPKKIGVNDREADYVAYINRNEEAILSVIDAR